METTKVINNFTEATENTLYAVMVKYKDSDFYSVAKVGKNNADAIVKDNKHARAIKRGLLGSKHYYKGIDIRILKINVGSIKEC